MALCAEASGGLLLQFLADTKQGANDNNFAADDFYHCSTRVPLEPCGVKLSNSQHTKSPALGPHSIRSK